MPPDSKETKLGSNHQRASLSAGKNAGVVLVLFCSWKCVPAVIFSVVDFPKGPGCHLSQ